MTDLNVSLSPTLSTTLNQQGVWAYAVYFDANGANPTWATMVEDGDVIAETFLTLPEPYVGGKVYFLIQSQPSTHPFDLETLITTESQISWNTAETWDFRYDSFEVTLQNSVNDVGNLTSVNGFGLPMALTVFYDDDTTSSRGYSMPAAVLFDEFDEISSNSIYTYQTGPLAGSPRMALSPTVSTTPGFTGAVYTPADWDDYIATLQTADTGVALTGFFNGAPDANHVWHNGGFFSYELEWDATANAFWLSPTANSQTQGYIKITADNLANSIYSTLGNVAVYTNQDDAEPYRILDNTTFASGDYSMNTGENNQWGEVLTQFLTGFTAGFYGTTGASLNTLIDDTVDLNVNWNWDPSYAFGENLSAPLPTGHFQDPYSEVFYFGTNSYGSGYSDNLMKQYAEGGPLVPVSQPDTGQNVDVIQITIFDDTETPSGYEPTVIYNYLPPDGSGYVVPTTTCGANVKLSFVNSGMVLTENTPIVFEVFAGLDGGVPTFLSTTPFVAPPGENPWGIWQLDLSGGSLTATLVESDQGTGNLLITNWPTANEDGTYWSRIHIGDKIFNLYTEMTEGGTQFANPTIADQAGSIAIDGLAFLAPQASTDDSIGTFTINFMPASTVTIEPDLLSFDAALYTPTYGAPFAPVAGTLAGGIFDALAGQIAPTTNTITTDESEIAFGWTGTNDAAGVDGNGGWIQAYTNKAFALNYAQISFEQGGVQVLPSVVDQADIDGQWQTGGVNLSNGTYTVTMQEYLADGSGMSSTAVGPQSGTLTLTVDVAELDLDAAAGGEGLELVSGGGDDPAGNWLSLEVLTSIVAPGTSLILYAINADGELVSRDGEQAGDGVTLEEATLATIGAAHADDGTQLLLGAQSAYLEVGLQLRFAVVSGSGAIDLDPGVAIVDLGDGVLEVTVGGFELQVQSDNDLSPEAMLGQAQRISNDALLYLEHGTTVDLQLVGSCGNVNTLAFVRMDIDLATGAMSVDGVDYGDTLAFRNAVKNNLDEGFEYRRGGNFTDTESWTVAGETGFYAPVLLTRSGNVFVIGDANPGGNEQIRMYGQNTFGFEDLTEAQGSDFDYNDMVMSITGIEPAGLDAGWVA